MVFSSKLIAIAGQLSLLSTFTSGLSRGGLGIQVHVFVANKVGREVATQVLWSMGLKNPSEVFP